MNDVVLTVGSNQFILQPKDAIEVMEILMSATQVEGHWPKADDNDKRTHRIASWPGTISIAQIIGEPVTQVETAQIKAAEKLKKEREEAAASVREHPPEPIDDLGDSASAPVTFEEVE